MTVALVGPGKMARAFFEAFRKHHRAHFYLRASTAESTMAKVDDWPALDGWSNKPWQDADAWVIGVKPAQYAEAIAPLMPIYQARKNNPPTIMSLMAGIRLNALMRDFKYSPILRVMANLSIAQTHGVYAVSKHGDCPAIEEQLDQMGQVLYFDDNQMDAATMLLGSAPAGMIAMSQAFAEAGVAQGLSTEASNVLVSSALAGASVLMATGKSPDTIIKNIASPNGTTQAMLDELHELSFICNKAVVAGCKRAEALAQEESPKLS